MTMASPNGKWQMANLGALRADCRDARCERNGKLKIASGKFQNCVADCKASQGVTY